MRDTDWKEMRQAAESLGEEYVAILESLGKDEILKIQRMVTQRFRAEGHADLTPSEWLIAIRRYQFAIEGRDLSEMETEKALRLAFQKQLLYDRMSKQLETTALNPALDKKSDPMGAITARNNFYKSRIRLRGLKEEKAAEIQKGDTEEAVSALADMAEFASEAIEMGYKFTTEVAEYEVSSAIGKIDRSLMKDIHGALEKLGKEIDSIEKELGLKTDRSEETYASKFNQTLQKAERFAKAHPREYTWHCPQCGWEGILQRRKPEEGKLVNGLDLWWTWKCPDCGTIIAYDRAHPLFDGKMLFWRRAWELVKRGVLSLKDAAYLHECAPEHLVVAAQQIYGEKLLPHVQEEWDEIEEKSRPTRQDDYKVQEAVSDGGELED